MLHRSKQLGDGATSGTHRPIAAEKELSLLEYESAPNGGVLSGDQIRQRILGEPPLLRDYLHLESQVQPNGFDLTLGGVHAFAGPGVIGVDNADRRLPDLEALAAESGAWIDLAPGAYHIVYNEIVQLPPDLMAFGRPRSTLNRCGATIHTAVWDAGYEGRSTSLLAVLNPAGIRLQIGARVMQLTFVTLARPSENPYAGNYQRENLGR